MTSAGRVMLLPGARDARRLVFGPSVVDFGRSPVWRETARIGVTNVTNVTDLDYILKNKYLHWIEL